MERKELIKIGSISIIFVLTNFLIKDLFELEGLHWTVVVGAVSASISLLLIHSTGRNFSLKTQIIITSIYCISALVIASTAVKKGNQKVKLSADYTATRSKNNYKGLIGIWVAPKKTREESNITFVFTENDTLTTFVNDSLKLIFIYKVTPSGHIKVRDRYGNDKSDWIIKVLDESFLELSDKTKKKIVFRKIK